MASCHYQVLVCFWQRGDIASIAKTFKNHPKPGKYRAMTSVQVHGVNYWTGLTTRPIALTRTARQMVNGYGWPLAISGCQKRSQGQLQAAWSPHSVSYSFCTSWEVTLRFHRGTQGSGFKRMSKLSLCNLTKTNNKNTSNGHSRPVL